MSYLDFIKFDKQLLKIQSIFISMFIATGILLSQFDFKIYQKRFKPEDIQMDINSVDKDKLEKIPYIGEKTASLIIEIRQNNGYFRDINQLRFLRDFEKFKYYIKVEEKNE